MDNIYNPFQYLQKVINDLIYVFKTDVQSVTLSIYKGTDKYVLDYLMKNEDMITKDIVKLLDEDAIGQYMSLIVAIRESGNSSDLIKSKLQNIINNIVILHVIIKLKEMSVFETKNIESYDELSIISSNNNCWYRGQSSVKWKLVPSFYRSLGSKSVLVDIKYLFNEYNRMKVIDRITSIYSSRLLNYQQLAFIQHSLALTPLLDFTTNIFNAASFAVSNLEKPHCMQDEPAAIYAISLNGNEIIDSNMLIDPIINKLNVEYIGSKPYISTLIRSKMWNDLLLGNVYSEYRLIDIKTNDRMRMQNGTFVLFNNVLIIGDDIVVSTITGRTLSKIITKYEIKVDKGQRYKMYLDIMSHESKYHLNNMMNPYDYMKD